MSDDQRAAVQQVFDGAADTYDAVGVSMFQPIAEQLVTDLSPRSGERALDVGCGRGAVLFRLADAVGPTGRAIGIDLSPRMVEATTADAGAAGLAVEVSVGDAQAQHAGGGMIQIGVTGEGVVVGEHHDARAGGLPGGDLEPGATTDHAAIIQRVTAARSEHRGGAGAVVEDVGIERDAHGRARRGHKAGRTGSRAAQGDAAA